MPSLNILYPCKQVPREQRGYCQTAEMLCWIVEFGWLRHHQKSNRKTRAICHEAPKRRRRFYILKTFWTNYYCSWLYILFNSTSGNNIYGDDVKETLLRILKEGSEEDAAYILMQRIFPTVSPTFLMRDGICHKEHAISELGVYSAYLRYILVVLLNPLLLLLSWKWRWIKRLKWF